MTKDYSKGKVYKIVNDIDDYIYIGSTVDRLSSRMAKHRFDVKNTNDNRKLYQHMRKYGVEQFRIILLEEYSCCNKDQLLQREHFHFDKYDKKHYLIQIDQVQQI